VRRLLAYLAPTRDASGVIYGTIVTASTIAAAAEGTESVLEVAAGVVVTLLLYWFAHAYAEVLGNSQTRVLSWGETRRELFAEWRMVGACVVPLAVLLALAGLGAGFQTATTMALWSSAGLLFLWGLLAAQRARASMTLAVVSGLIYTAIGIAIVALKLTLVRH
jgi:hypothetical protein